MSEPLQKQLNDKPTGANLGWHLQQTERPQKGKVLVWRRDHIKVQGNNDMVYCYIEKAPAVLIVPVTADGNMMLIRQYRYPIDEWCLEIPAGGTHDTGDTPLEEVAIKELEEEIGATCSRLELITTFYAEPSLTDEKCTVYLAHGVELDLQPHTESTEDIELLVVPIDEALRMAQEGQMKSGPCTLAIFLCQKALGRHEL